MKSNQKLLILFWLKKSKATKNGTAPLYARITIDGESEVISLSRKAHPDNWDSDLKRVTDPSPEARKTNLKIAQVENDLSRHFTVLQSQFESIRPLMLKNVYHGLPAIITISNKEIDELGDKTLLESFSDFIIKFDKQVKAGQRSKDTLKHWNSAKNKLESFLVFQYQSTDINLNEIRYCFAEEFYDFHTLEVDEPIQEITAKGYLKKIKQILKACVKRGYLVKNPIAEFSCGGGDKEVAPLEMHEVQKIVRKKLTIKRLIEVRDAFVFQMFTGFAFQDIYALSQENITRVGNSGERWLIKDRGKTGVSEMVPILPIVEELIKTYSQHPFCKANNVLIPVNCNTRYNGYLKELADICGIERELNTHLARHTFADIMLNAGVPLEDVSKMLGHKSIRTTQRYCRVRKERISQNMEKAKSILFNKNGQLRILASV